MPANVENMFSVKQVPWHRLGTVLDQAPKDIREAMKLAGLDWTVERIPVPVCQGCTIAEDDNVVMGHYFIRVENVDGEVSRRQLSIVGPNTHALQNVDAFDFFQPFLDDGTAELETAGSLDNGRRIWVMATIKDGHDVIVPGDETLRFLLLSNSHDGSMAVRVGFTPVRVVCANTLAVAHSNKASKLIRIKHAKDVKANVDALRETIDLANKEFSATVDQYRYLAHAPINQRDLQKYVRQVLEIDEEADTKLHGKTQNMLDAVIDSYTEQRALVAAMLGEREDRDMQAAQFVEKDSNGSLLDAALDATMGAYEEANAASPRSADSYWTAYNAVNSYLCHKKGRTEETRLNSVWFGDSAKVNHRALDLAMKMAND